MREEVTVESNQILTIERRSASRAARQREGGAGAGGNNGGEVPYYSYYFFTSQFIYLHGAEIEPDVGSQTRTYNTNEIIIT